MASIVEQIFSSYSTETSLKNAIKAKQAEGLYLEFKQKKDSRKSELDKDDKKNFSEGLSQFANSDGGVQIWGIETKGPNDMAFKLKPIDEVDRFVNNLKSYFKDAVQPMVDGVLIGIIYKNKKNNVGYVKVLIPQSDKTPHRAMYSREYLKRNLEGKYKLEHFDLEDMFGRRQKPNLILYFKEKKKQDISSYWIFIRNDGRAVGKLVQVVLRCPCKEIADVEVKIRSGQLSRIDDLHNDIPAYQFHISSDVYYPLCDARIGEVNITSIHKDDQNLEFHWYINAEDMLMKTGKVIIGPLSTKK